MIKLYTNHCRKCEILTAKLKEKNIAFDVEDNAEVLLSRGFDFMPMLEVDGRLLNYGEAVKYVNAQ